MYSSEASIPAFIGVRKKPGAMALTRNVVFRLLNRQRAGLDSRITFHPHAARTRRRA